MGETAGGRGRLIEVSTTQPVTPEDPPAKDPGEIDEPEAKPAPAPKSAPAPLAAPPIRPLPAQDRGPLPLVIAFVIGVAVTSVVAYIVVT